MLGVKGLGRSTRACGRRPLSRGDMNPDRKGFSEPVFVER